MSIVKTAALLAVVGTASACTSPLHLTYDYGRSYTESIVAQADLTRPSAAEAHYSLYGVEAVNIRIRVQEEATDAETGETELDQNSD